MLSDEEKKAIDVLKYVKNKTPFIFWYEEKPYNRKETIIIILNLIEKQSKEIEELKDKNKKLQDKAKELIFEKQELSPALLDSTPNDKIKAKIQECREILYSFEKELELKANKEKYIHKESMNCLLSQISILQSLLEKE